jgi:hypothetical protein
VVTIAMIKGSFGPALRVCVDSRLEQFADHSALLATSSPIDHQ